MGTHYLRIAGLKRSGNHTITNWLLGLFPGTYYYHNNSHRVKAETLVKPDSTPLRLGIKNLLYTPVGKDDDKDLIMVSYEDYKPDKVFPHGIEKNYKKFFGATSYTNVIILRDPYNMAASRLHREYSSSNKMPHSISQGKHKSLAELWKQYAKFFLDKEDKPDWLCICYNKWFYEINYRRQLADKLMRPFTDVGLEGAGTMAGRSSFERNNTNTRDYKIEERWLYYIKHPAYQLFIKDKEMAKLSRITTGFTLPAEYPYVKIPLKTKSNKDVIKIERIS